MSYNYLFPPPDVHMRASPSEFLKYLYFLVGGQGGGGGGGGRGKYPATAAQENHLKLFFLYKRNV